MDVNLQRKIDRIVGTIICRILAPLPQKETGPGDAQPSKFLVILLSEMGSLVLSKPMFEHIRKQYPYASIYALCFERNREFLEILDLLPPKNISTVRGDSLWGLLWDSIRALSRLRKKKIDTVLDCELFSRISSIYSFLSGAKIRVGFHPHTQEGLFRGNFINRPVLYNPYLHISEQFVNLAEAIESDHKPRVKRRIQTRVLDRPSIKIGQSEKEELRRRFMADFPQIERTKLVLIYPSGGLLPIRAWPLENFCLVAEDFIKHGYTVGVIGMKTDGALAERILSHCRSKNCIDLTGYTKTVRELLILFHFATLLITNDGGPGHFASMTPMPAIILFGPETPTIYGSLDKKSIHFHVPLSCSPCLTAYNHRNSPCDGDNVCLKSIAPEEVLRKAYEMLGEQNSYRLEGKRVEWRN